jgi:RecA/RadA recombinase
MSMKPFDVSKFRKSITKSISGLSVGFNDPTDWISTGNYALNYLISGDFNKGVPMGKVTVFAGESGCLPKDAKVTVRYKLKEEEVTVGELRDMYMSNEYDIEMDTPDGYQPLGEWYDKGELHMVSIVTENNSTTCAVNHLIQLNDESWVLADELSVGDVIKTRSGVDVVLETLNLESKQECYDFEILHNNHRYYGDGIVSHNSGKSFISSGNIVRNAQQQGIYVVLIDTENALDEAWLKALDVDTSEDKLLRLSMSMIDDVAKTISTFMDDYKKLEEEERPKVLFVVDSLGMLLTPTDVAQFDKGDLKGDLGRKPKALTALVRNTVNMIGAYNVGFIATNHTYASQDLFDPDDKISGGCLTEGHNVRLWDGGIKDISMMEIGDYVTTLDGKCEVVNTFHYSDKPLFRLNMEDGSSIECTEEHRFMVETDDGYVWKRVHDLCDGDAILRTVDV